MLATRCRERGPATGADHVAFPAVAVALAGGNTATMAAAITNTVATTVPATGSSTAAPSSGSSATPTVREGRGCRQGDHHQSEHEHSVSCHVAPPP